MMFKIIDFNTIIVKRCDVIYVNLFYCIIFIDVYFYAEYQ